MITNIAEESRRIAIGLQNTSKGEYTEAMLAAAKRESKETGNDSEQSPREKFIGFNFESSFHLSSDCSTDKHERNSKEENDSIHIPNDWDHPLPTLTPKPRSALPPIRSSDNSEKSNLNVMIDNGVSVHVASDPELI